MSRTRRRRPPPPQRLFRGRELGRLMSMLGMLAVLWMMMVRAGDQDTWRWLANDPGGGRDRDVLAEVPAEPQQPAAKPAEKSPAEWSPPVVPGPTDEDPEEWDAAREQFQAVSDKESLHGEEMPAYWRLLRWARAQSFDELRKRANHNLFFTQLAKDPEKNRGKLFELKMHLMQSLEHEDVPENSAGVKELYEARGWTEESKANPYLVVFADRPPKLPLGADIREEATFVGYFLKLLSYEDGLGRRRCAHARRSPGLAGKCRSGRPAARRHRLLLAGHWRRLAGTGGDRR